MENTVLKISHLTKHFGSKLILNDISVEVNEGEIFGFVGPNGSGKTTTIKVMLGLLSLEAGEVSICGYDIKTDFRKAVENVGGIIENPELYGHLSGYENLMQVVRMHDSIPKSRIDEVVALVGLADRINDKVSKYSLGMRQRLGLAQALINKPKLLVLDEPTNGLDPIGIKELRDILLRISHEEGTAVFISSHQLAELDLICDRFAVIDSGNVIAVKSMEEVRGSHGDIEQFEIVVETEALEATKTVLDEIEGNNYKLSGNKFTVTADLSAGGSGLNATVKKLVMADISISSAAPVKHSLEDAFVEITTGKSETRKPFTPPIKVNDTQNVVRNTSPFMAPDEAESEKKDGGDAE